MRALERKLLRDLWLVRGQVLTIALVVAAGIAGYVSLQSTYTSLLRSRDAYYYDYRFGNVFAHLRRAPESLRPALEAVPGVAQVYTRVLDYVRLPLPNEAQPPVATLVTLPESGEPALNAIRLERGRLPERGRAGEALLLEGFANHRGIVPGDTLPVVIKGTRYVLRIVGLANSPEFIYPVQPGAISFDEERAAVLWMDREGIAPALDMEGAFNDVVFRTEPGAVEAEVLADVDRVLEPWGCLGSVGRRLQMSNYVLDGELEQLRSYATVVPAIFLAVSAFLLNVVLARLVELERGQIATLKAVGYGNWQIGLHYLGFVSIVVLLGAGIGLGVGAWLGGALTGLYADVFHLPILAYRLHLPVVGASIVASLLAAAAGAIFSARRVMQLAPAEAMRPPAPVVYRPLLIERLHLGRFVTQAWRMVLREFERVPLRAIFSMAGIAVATGLIILGRFMYDATEYLFDFQFGVVAREDLNVDFTDATADRSVRELAHLRGVLRAEGMRAIPVRMNVDQVHRDVPLIGYAADAQLRRVMDWKGNVVALAPDGVVLTRKLAEILRVEPGDTVDVRVMQGERLRDRLVVQGLVDEMFGLQGYLLLPRLNRLLREGPTVTSAQLRIDPVHEADLRRRLADLPGVAAVTSLAAERAHVRRQMGETMNITMTIITLFAATIAVGVVYNNARIALSTRSRELASLRVLGFTRAEISRVLLGELGIQLVLALPPGLLIGRWLTGLVTGSVDPERYRLPVTISSQTYAFAAVIVLVAGAVSALLVRRHLDRLDLIGVLKTRE